MNHPQGRWPVDTPVDLDGNAAQQATQHLQWAAERARCQIIRDSVREHLAEQPSAQAVRAVHRLYTNDFDRYAAEAIKALKSTETTQ
ncbi:hypothetical protein ACFQ61_04785 [Streptomyces sp. NPDC056500]|uniref:hypothetical protein n=1 Tax=Streptomyces sp. NPDC056500 TaxID=3345840 RepID=UPI003675C9F2